MSVFKQTVTAKEAQTWAHTPIRVLPTGREAFPVTDNEGLDCQLEEDEASPMLGRHKNSRWPKELSVNSRTI